MLIKRNFCLILYIVLHSAILQCACSTSSTSTVLLVVIGCDPLIYFLSHAVGHQNKVFSLTQQKIVIILTIFYYFDCAKNQDQACQRLFFPLEACTWYQFTPTLANCSTALNSFHLHFVYAPQLTVRTGKEELLPY